MSRSKRWRTWSPFQSARTRQICEHLTEEEYSVLARRNPSVWQLGALTAAMPIGLAVALSQSRHTANRGCPHYDSCRANSIVAAFSARVSMHDPVGEGARIGFTEPVISQFQ